MKSIKYNIDINLVSEEEAMDQMMNKDEKDYLASYHQNDYERPSLAADTVIFTISNEEASDIRRLSRKNLSILLIKRGEHPYKDLWALPGGFVRKGETLEDTAYRELQEEAGVADICLSQLHTFSEPNRDPRGWIMSCAYMALAEEDKFHLKAGTDASEADWFHINYKLLDTYVEDQENEKVAKNVYKLTLTCKETNLYAIIEKNNYFTKKGLRTKYVIKESNGIAFDHSEIIAFAIEYLRKNLDESMLAFELLPDRFTLTDLQHVYETILDEELLTANFRRKIAEYVSETNDRVEGAGHRPSKLFKRNFDKLL